MACWAVEMLRSLSWPGKGLCAGQYAMLLLLQCKWPDWRKCRRATGNSNLPNRRQPASSGRTNVEPGKTRPPLGRRFLLFLGPLITIVLLLTLGPCIKLSCVFCLQKVRIYKISKGGRSGTQTARAKAWGKSKLTRGSCGKLCSSPWGYDGPPNQQETVTGDRPSPLSAPREWGAGRKAEEGIVTSKATNNSWETEIESG